MSSLENLPILMDTSLNLTDDKLEESVQTLTASLAIRLVDLALSSDEARNSTINQDALDVESPIIGDPSQDDQPSEEFSLDELDELSIEHKADQEQPISTISLEEQKSILDRKVLQAVKVITKESLLFDPFLDEAPKTFNVPEEQRIRIDRKNRLVFCLRQVQFDSWLARYEDYISLRFNSRGNGYVSKSTVRDDSAPSRKNKAGTTTSRYDCHCRGVNSPKEDSIRGEKSGQARNRAPSVRVKRESYFNHILRPRMPTADGKFEDMVEIEYDFRHNHKIGDMTDIGNSRKSKAVRERIRALLLRGMSIQAIMDRLTIDHARFSRLIENGEFQKLSRDHFITYDDVYNI
ncbi:hypothetical protein BGZ49_001178, partial [Haplosporangium sp. Z 27]